MIKLKRCPNCSVINLETAKTCDYCGYCFVCCRVDCECNPPVSQEEEQKEDRQDNCPYTPEPYEPDYWGAWYE